MIMGLWSGVIKYQICENGGSHMEVKGIDNLQYGYQQPRTGNFDSNVTDNTTITDNHDLKTIKSQDNSKNDDDQPLSEKEQQRRMERLQDTLKNHNIEISYNEEVNRYAIKVLDTDTKEVVKEIPSEKTLEMFARMLEIEGLLVDEKG